MRKVLLLAVVGLLCISLSSLAGEVITNDTGEDATGLKVVFSMPAEITAFGDILMHVDQEGPAQEFIFSGGTVEPWGSHWFSYSPAAASVLEYEWLGMPTTRDVGRFGFAEQDYPGYCGFLLTPCGISRDWVGHLPDDYFNFLCRTNANWVGIHLLITVRDSLDSTVEIYGQESDRQPGDGGSAFTDEELVALIRRLKDDGLHVYVVSSFAGLGFEEDGTGMHRYELGNPDGYKWLLSTTGDGTRVDLWPWHPTHPDHSRFVAEFYRTYSDTLVHYASIAEEEGVDLFGLGTETDYLFMTREKYSLSSVEYAEELTEMIRRIRTAYSGPLTYDMHEDAFQDRYFAGMPEMWGDLGLDVIGISAHFALLDSVPTEVPSVADLTQGWERVFNDYLKPLSERYPGKPLVFAEYAEGDWPGSSANKSGDYSSRDLIDLNNNGLDDGQEEQANSFEALFTTINRQPGVVDGMFFFGDMIAPDFAWEQTFGRTRCGGLRYLLAEEVVAEYFALYTGIECIPNGSATAVQEHLAMQFDHESEIAYFCNGPKGLSTARNWGLNGSRVRGVIAEAEDSTFRCGIVLDEADQFGPYGYLLRFIPQTATTLDIYFDPWSGDVYFTRISGRNEQEEFDLASAVSIAISKTEFEVSLDLSSLLDELGISLEAFLASEVTLTLDYGDNICTEFFEFPGSGNIMQVEAHSS